MFVVTTGLSFLFYRGLRSRLRSLLPIAVTNVNLFRMSRACYQCHGRIRMKLASCRLCLVVNLMFAAVAASTEPPSVSTNESVRVLFARPATTPTVGQMNPSHCKIGLSAMAPLGSQEAALNQVTFLRCESPVVIL
jgi:hypothetical protein